MDQPREPAPVPASREAIEAGCICPPPAEHAGQASYVVDPRCPVHGQESGRPLPAGTLVPPPD